MCGLLLCASENSPICGVFIISLGLLILAGCVYRKFSVADFAVITVSFAVAFSVGNSYIGKTYRKITAFDGTTGSFSGKVCDISTHDKGFATYVLNGKINGFQKAKITVFCDELDVEYGDIVSIENCVFSEISDDFLYSLKNYYRSEKIFLEAEKPENISVEHKNSDKIKNSLMNFRSGIISKFRIILGKDCGNFLAGMVFGEKSELDGNIKTSLYKTGIGHILAVSGLHISVLSIAVSGLLRALRVNKYVNFIIVNIFMVLMTIMAEFPVSAVRAVIMAEFLYISRLIFLQSDTLTSLSWASLLICVVNPFAVYSSGFILSLAGAFGAGVFAPFMTKNLPKDSVFQRTFNTICFGVCTLLAVLPVGILFFGEMSLLAPILGVILIPLCTVSMLLGVMFTLTAGIFPFLLFPSGSILKIVMAISEFVADIKIFQIHADDSFASIIILVSSLPLVYGFVKRNRKSVSVAVSLSILTISVLSPVYRILTEKNEKIAVLRKDGDTAIVAISENSCVVIDMGGNNTSARYVGKYIENLGSPCVDAVILTKNSPAQIPNYERELKFAGVGRFIVQNSFSYNIGKGKFSMSYDSENLVYTISVGDFGISVDGDSKNPISSLPDGCPEFFEIIPAKDGLFSIRRLYG